MNRERIELLIKKLDEIQTMETPLNRFDMASWAHGPQACGEDGIFANKCGTSACAMGWATTIPEFKEAGLQLINDPPGGPRWILSYGQFVDFLAAAEFLNILHYEAVRLFANTEYGPGELDENGVADDSRYDIQPGEVADRLRSLLAGGLI